MKATNYQYGVVNIEMQIGVRGSKSQENGGGAMKSGETPNDAANVLQILIELQGKHEIIH